MKYYSDEEYRLYKRVQNAKRRAAKLHRTPDWLTNEEWAQIQGMYEACPSTHHVDHVVPLQGEAVSGLHVPWNLQLLEAHENLSKSNTL